ncbi:hypothetical protein BGZ98_002716 [Dissophora globulifera]|nr:hypothetical protein BGZ98_002716 [Dissophora globulifera]
MSHTLEQEHFPQDLAGKVAFVTASSKNLGKGFLMGLAQRGADVVIHHLENPIEAKQVAQEVQALGRKAFIVQGDLTDVAVVKKIFAEFMAHYGRIDIVVNNAATITPGTVNDHSEADYDLVFNTNAKAPFFIMQECAKHMSDNGRVINITSNVLRMLSPYTSTYAGSKAALEQFTKAFAKEVGHRGITVNAVAPGVVDTDMMREHAPPELIEASKKDTVMGRLGQVSDIVPVVVFLASPAGQWVTTQSIFVTGGAN